MVYRENNGYGDVNHVLYQILKHADEDTRNKMENRLKSNNEKKYLEYKEFEKRWDNVKTIKLSF
ncbi:MAG: hypothetical protein E7Z80_03990 [Methanobrevibacter thaueri]|nr:hypothetical protein [Methanobrevibacter thaueri]